MEKRNITGEDLYKMRFTGSPSISPDGQTAVYIVTELSEDKNGYRSSLYISDLNDKSQQLTYPYHQEKLIRDSSPKWSFDGQSIAFLSNRTEKQQIWLLPKDGGEARQLTDCPEGVTEFNWAPDSNGLVFTANEKTDEDHNDDFKVISRLRYKGDGEGTRNTYQHIYLYTFENGKANKLTEGSFNHYSPSFSPSGEHIVYLASKRESHELVNLNDLYVFDLKTETEKMLYKGKGPVIDPVFSPDGDWIAFGGHEEGEVSSSNTWVWALPAEGGEARNLSAAFDHPVGNYVGVDAGYDGGGSVLQWENHSKEILFMSTVGGDCHLKRVSLKGEVADAAVYNNNVITSFDSSGETIVFIKADPHSPGDLFVQQSDGLQQLSNHNEELFSEIELGTPESFNYKAEDDWDLEGWLLPPVKRKENEICPVVLQIHGGPHTAYGNAFHHEFQLLAAHGYAVVYTNPRGSQGYGDEFVKACVGDWGNKDRKDIMLGLDSVLEHYDYCDPERLYVTGGSYGGFMTNMIISHSDRFRAAVTQRCISNMYSFFGTSDIGFYFGSAQLGDVDLWEDEETIMRFSPIRYARNVKTPTCIIHSEEDLRCPIEQAEQWYVALTRLGVETRFIRFQGENHNLSRSGKPKNRFRRLKEMVDWFNKH